MMDCNRADIGVGPRSSDDLDDADVAAIPSGLGAQLQDEVGPEVADEAAPPADGKKWPKEDLGLRTRCVCVSEEVRIQTALEGREDLAEATGGGGFDVMGVKTSHWFEVLFY